MHQVDPSGVYQPHDGPMQQWPDYSRAALMHHADKSKRHIALQHDGTFLTVWGSSDFSHSCLHSLACVQMKRDVAFHKTWERPPISLSNRTGLNENTKRKLALYI